jgi:CRISPR-associated protein Cas1
MEAFESRVLDLPDFYFTGDDYRYRFETEAKRHFVGLLRERFNAGVRYDGRVLKWDAVIERKAIELARCLTDKSDRLSFDEPAPVLERSDSYELREKIRRLTRSEAGKLGIGRSTLHYLRKKAEADRPFKVYREIREKLKYEPLGPVSGV